MFKLKANPTIDARVTITGQGREQTLNLTFRHKTRSEYQALWEDVAGDKRKIEDVLVELIEKWDADANVSVESIRLLQDHQPGADFAILSAYNDALTVARKGN